MPTGHVEAQAEGGAEYSIHMKDRIVNGHVMWTDYEYAMVYECFDRNEDGTCPPRRASLVVYGRTRDLPEDTIEKMMTALEGQICATREDFERVPQKSKSCI